MRLGCFGKVASFLLSLCFILSAFNLLPQPASSLGTDSLQSRPQKYFLSPAKELELLKKILVFERNWRSEASGTLVIGILYQKSNSISVWTMDDWLDLQSSLSREESRVDNINLVLQPVDLDSPQPLDVSLQELKVRFVYLTPLELANKPKLLPAIFKTCEKLKVGTFTAVPEYLEAGAALGFIWTGERHQIVINLEAARAQGLNFSSQLLKLATIRKAHD